MTISDLIVYLFAQTSENIRQLKADAYQATEHEKFAYRSPDGKSFHNKRPSEEVMAEGWTFAKVKFTRTQSYMSPKHESWAAYRQAKRRANRLMAARLILKANAGVMPPRDELSDTIAAGALQSQARPNVQKSLGFKAHRLLTKLENRLKKQPEKFGDVVSWTLQRRERETANV